MIKIEFSNNKVKIQGHAGHREMGQDIYCAAVSTLVCTFINAYDVKVLTFEPGNCEVEWETADTHFLKTGLQILAMQHPEYVQYVEVKTGG